jgi:hypothetical protein
MSKSRKLSVDELQALVLDVTHARSVVVDEQYTLTAFVVERDPGRHVVVEVIDRGAAGGEARWAASAYDERGGQGTDLNKGATAREAVRSLDWAALA